MKIFEFYFNPKKQPHTKYESFCYEPANAEEKRLGYLCAAGELTNILPTNARLLRELAVAIRTVYYSPSHADPAIAAQNAMRAANSHLAALGKKENISWLGNLHFAAVSVAGDLVQLSKAGNIKVLLARDGQMLDIGADLENPNLTPYSTRVFPNLVEGKLLAQDKIIILTKEIFQFFDALGVLRAFTHLPTGNEHKKVKELLRPYEKQLKDYSGIFVLLVMDKIASAGAKKREFPRVSFSIPSLPRLPAIKLPAIKGLKIKPPSLPTGIPTKISIPVRVSSPNILSFLHQLFSPESNESRKKIFLVFAFLLVLVLGISIAKIQDKRTNDAAENKFLAIQQKMWQAESLLIAQKESEANILFQESLEELNGLDNAAIRNRVEKTRKEVEEKLTIINKVENVGDPTLGFTIENPDFSPSIILVLQGSLYVLAPSQPTMYIWDTQKQESSQTDLQWSFDAAVDYDPFLIFYDKKQNNIIAGDGEVIALKLPYPEFAPNTFTSFMSGLYFLDAPNGSIVRYPFFEGQTELAPVVWTAVADKSIKDGVSLAIDGSIWILSQEGSILRYRGGKWQETIQTTLWPKLSHPAKIITGSTLPYLYILDPPENRIVILDKRGNAVKQYRSEKLNKLKDFTVTSDGKTIYLLNSTEIYSLSVL